MPFKQVTIIGTGLIGGSLGLALKKRRLAGRIVGCDRAPVLEKAERCGAIDTGTANPADAVRGSDLVVLATPVIPILDLIGRLGPALPPKTLVTDVGSTKAEIVQRAAKSFGRHAGQRFLAGHPMAGKESAGVEFAAADLFEGAAWLFTADMMALMSATNAASSSTLTPPAAMAWPPSPMALITTPNTANAARSILTAAGLTSPVTASMVDAFADALVSTGSTLD